MARDSHQDSGAPKFTFQSRKDQVKSTYRKLEGAVRNSKFMMYRIEGLVDSIDSLPIGHLSLPLSRKKKFPPSARVELHSLSISSTLLSST